MQWFVVAGAAVFGMLGLMHGVLTWQSTPERGAFTPLDPVHREAFAREGSIGLAPEVTLSLWNAWIGFNLSHSLGVVLAAALLGIPALLDFEGALANPGWVACALILPLIYLGLSLRYWFDKPTRGISLGTLLVYVGVLGAALPGLTP
ncbi:MAG: hypothetical protein KTR31_13190 [Myxococcales bacterium]|nr:hypothetical protein [Myxococcales bacterium]